MGTPMTKGHAVVKQGAGAATPLLRFLAGPHAETIACAWPAPHAGFYALPSARRHAAAILLDRAQAVTSCEAASMVHAIERVRDPDVARLLMRGEAPGGLMKALGRIGEQLWSSKDYEALLMLFSNEETAKIARHTDDIRPEWLNLVRRIPAPIRVPGVLANIPDTPGAADDLAASFRLALRIQGNLAAGRIAERWSRANSPQRLFEMAFEDLQPVSSGLPDRPLDLSAEFFRVPDRKILNEVAMEFRNCLRDFTSDIANGRMAVYVLRDGRERAAVALRWDPAGWRLAEARGVANEEVGDETLRFIVEAVERAGGRTGESSWAVANRLHDHACGNCGPAHMPRRETWREQLALGTLWD